MVISPKGKSGALPIIDGIISNKNRYVSVTNVTGVPWFMIGCIHSLECSSSFKLHLHNGDPLTDRTKNVPPGRPLKGKPPFSWEDSAIDALIMKIKGGWPQKDFENIKNDDIISMLYLMELYNGMGYRHYHPEVKTPYLWAGSNNYTRGKYVADGEFDPNAKSGQIGAAILLKIMKEKNVMNNKIENLESIDNVPISLSNISKENAINLQKLMNGIASSHWKRPFKPLDLDGKIGKESKKMFNNIFGTNIT